jgi:hypothetical protein
VAPTPLYEPAGQVRQGTMGKAVDTEPAWHANVSAYSEPNVSLLVSVPPCNIKVGELGPSDETALYTSAGESVMSRCCQFPALVYTHTSLAIVSRAVLGSWPESRTSWL